MPELLDLVSHGVCLVCSRGEFVDLLLQLEDVLGVFLSQSCMFALLVLSYALRLLQLLGQ